MITKIVNLVGGPCCGKSTTAAGLFAAMKLKSDQKVEIVTEVIKDYVYDENKGAMHDQILITAQQNHRLRRLQGKVDFIISDASLLNGVVYNEFYKDSKNLSTQLSIDLFNEYDDNLVFLLPRKPQYDQYGRTQSLEEAKHLDRIFMNKLHELDVDYFDMTRFTHEEMPEKILEILGSMFKFEVRK
jgi:hypothetical protein